MQTAIASDQRHLPEVQAAESILRACVHCGFCNATCPTYQLWGTELEGPRGRIYLIKSVLEGRTGLTPSLVGHLDNCLSCMACETTCPSGVRYSHLIDPARARIERTYRRGIGARLQRRMLATMLPRPGLFRWALRMARFSRPLRFLLPGGMRAMVAQAPARLPARSRLDRPGVIPAEGQRRARVALLTGCAQKVVGPQINDASIRFLTRIGCEVVLPKAQGCCGALVFHMGNEPGSLPHMRNNIDVWHAEMQGEGLDAVIINTSGCGSVVKDYGHIFRNDAAYAEKAAAVSGIVQDITEFAASLGVPEGHWSAPQKLRVAYHEACSLQHAQKVTAQPRALLGAAGYEVADIPDGHLCCGSAGTYNLLHPGTGADLGRNKAAAIASVQPKVVAAGNIGCMEQIASHSRLPVVHTVELLDWASGGPKPTGLD